VAAIRRSTYGVRRRGPPPEAAPAGAGSGAGAGAGAGELLRRRVWGWCCVVVVGAVMEGAKGDCAWGSARSWYPFSCCGVLPSCVVAPCSPSPLPPTALRRVLLRLPAACLDQLVLPDPLLAPRFPTV
jgi:hypothetical protein